MSGPTSATMVQRQNGRLQLSGLQQAWLTEIGLERRILGHYLPVASGARPAVAPEPSAPSPASLGTGPALSGSELAMAALKQVGGQRRPSPPGTAADIAPAAIPQPSHPVNRRQDLPVDWAALQTHAQGCQACGLYSQRDQLVFGAGDLQQPEWLIVGEAPGKADDRTGQPFQGKSGKLLHAMLVAAGVHPTSVVLGGRSQLVPAWSQPTSMYFSNLIKCRPLGNRPPAAAEIAACMPYLKQQIELLQPKRILALGRLAAQSVLNVQDEVEALRGRVHHVSTEAGVQIPVVVTWHPAVLLMHPQNKGQAWADLMLAKRL